MSTEKPEITSLLNAWSSGDAGAGEQVMACVYDELRRLARAHLRRERSEHTLQPTALVHEVFLRLIDQNAVTWQSRTQFFCIASRIMRRVLVDYARRHRATKRGGAGVRVSLDDSLDAWIQRPAELIALDDALTGLADLDARKSAIVELRYFGGLTQGEIAEMLGVAEVTVRRHWTMAREWLREALEGRPPADGP